MKLIRTYTVQAVKFDKAGTISALLCYFKEDESLIFTYISKSEAMKLITGNKVVFCTYNNETKKRTNIEVVESKYLRTLGNRSVCDNLDECYIFKDYSDIAQ